MVVACGQCTSVAKFTLFNIIEGLGGNFPSFHYVNDCNNNDDTKHYYCFDAITRDVVEVHFK